MSGRKKSVSRKKSGGRQKPNTLTLTGRKGTKGRREVKTMKIPQSGYMTTIDAMTKRVKRKWWVLDKGWYKDPGLRQLAKSDAQDIISDINIMGFDQFNKIEKKHGGGASYAREALEIRLAKEFLSQRDPKWPPVRMAWVAAELEDRNYHPIANYIRFVEIGEIPYDEYLAFRRKHIHKIDEKSAQLQNGKVVNVEAQMQKLENWLDEEFSTKHNAEWSVIAYGDVDSTGIVTITTELTGIRPNTFDEGNAQQFEHKSREFAAQLLGTAEVTDRRSGGPDSWIVEVKAGMRD